MPPCPARRAAELCFFLSLPRSPCSLPKVGKPSRSKHNTLPGGTLQIRSLGKDDHGEWECVATNVVASITASTHLTVVGTGRRGPRGLGDGWWWAPCAPGGHCTEQGVTHGVGMLPVMSNVSLYYNLPVVLHSLFLYFGHLRVWISRNPA